MDNEKWLKRKYPYHFEEVTKVLDEERLRELKEQNFKIGRLVKKTEGHKKGKLIFFKRSNPVNNYNYPLHYAFTKCKKGETYSGYHGFGLHESDFEEINPTRKERK